ncbi:carbon-nitrogen family hydrolase [Thermodesulfovibrio hydrogeniphilus]
MKIAIAQFDIIWKNPSENLKKIEKIALEASASGSNLLVLPEASTTGFCMEDIKIDEDNEYTEKFFMKLASELNINIIAGYFLLKNNKKQNVAKVFSRNGEVLSSYSKIHLFSLLEEHKHFSAGDSPVLFNIEDFCCSVFICYDLRFPELFRKVIPKAEVIFVLANWPSSRAEHWSCLLRARAIENQCYIVGVNRVGKDGNGLEYAGGSAVYGPFGETLLMTDNRESIFYCEINHEYLLDIRRRFPFLNDL